MRNSKINTEYKLNLNYVPNIKHSLTHSNAWLHALKAKPKASGSGGAKGDPDKVDMLSGGSGGVDLAGLFAKARAAMVNKWEQCP